MLVSEIFYSLQGEGPHIGEPCVFIRLGGCIEPYCPWCDTAYAWHEYEEMDMGGIMRRVKEFRCSKVVLTGGEPFLQWETGLRSLHEVLAADGYDISYETSGKAGIPEFNDACIVVSPKYLAGRWQIDTEDLKRAHYFKFVVEDKASFTEAHEFIQRNALPREKVYIMPMGQTRNEQLRRMAAVFTFCRDHGYNMTPRLHILAFDAGRGV